MPEGVPSLVVVRDVARPRGTVGMLVEIAVEPYRVRNMLEVAGVVMVVALEW